MAFKHKYSCEEKKHVLMEYLNSTHGFRELCRIYGRIEGLLKSWIHLHNAFGWDGLTTGNMARCYSSETPASRNGGLSFRTPFLIQKH